MNLRTTLMAAPTAVSLVLLASLVAVLMAMNRYEARVSATHEEGAARQDAIAATKQRLSETHAGLYRTITVIGSMSGRHRGLPGQAFRTGQGEPRGGGAGADGRRRPHGRGKGLRQEPGQLHQER